MPADETGDVRGLAERVDEDVAECLRIESGRPRLGLDMDAQHDPPGGRAQRARGQLHQGLLRGPGDRRPPATTAASRTATCAGCAWPRRPRTATPSCLGEKEVGTVGSACVSPSFGPDRARAGAPRGGAGRRGGGRGRARPRSSSCRSPTPDARARLAPGSPWVRALRTFDAGLRHAGAARRCRRRRAGVGGLGPAGGPRHAPSPSRSSSTTGPTATSLRTISGVPRPDDRNARYGPLGYSIDLRVPVVNNAYFGYDDGRRGPDRLVPRHPADGSRAAPGGALGARRGHRTTRSATGSR